MYKHPLESVRSALSSILDHAAFNYSEGSTRKLVAQAHKTLRETNPPVAHEPPVGIYKYDTTAGAYIPVQEAEAKDEKGNLREGYIYLFKQVGMTRH